MSLFCAELLLTEKAASGKTALPAESFLSVSEKPDLTVAGDRFPLGLEVHPPAAFDRYENFLRSLCKILY